jgi:hypothetical protein
MVEVGSINLDGVGACIFQKNNKAQKCLTQKQKNAQRLLSLRVF